MNEAAEIGYWALIALGVLAAVFVLIALFGALLPRQHVVARALQVGRSPEAAWQVLSDYPSLPSWNKDVIAVERLPDHDGRAVWRETYKGNYPIRVEVVEAVPPRRLVRSIAGEKGPFRGRWEFDLEPLHGEGCRITLTEHGEIANPFFRFMARLLMNPATYLERYLQALAGRLGGP